MDWSIKRRKENRNFLVAYLGGKCEGCGSRDNLQFDHKDPSNKAFHIATNLTSSRRRLVEEAKKCQLLCYPCHKLKTREDMRLWWLTRVPEIEHGTISTYTNKDCRCVLCRGANAIYMRQYKLRMAT